MSHQVFVQKTTSAGKDEFHVQFREQHYYMPRLDIGYLTQQLIAGGLPYEEIDPVVSEARRQYDQLTGADVDVGTWANPNPDETKEPPPSPRQQRRRQAAADKNSAETQGEGDDDPAASA